MALDKSVAKRIATQSNKYLIEDDVFHDFCNMFAQAIYALGVKDERERCAKVCELDIDGIGIIAIECAEAIRKGEPQP